MILEILKQHTYLYIFLLTIIEGPITSFISAGLAAQGLLNIEYIIIIAFVGDIIMDVILYTIGRLSVATQKFKNFKYFNKEKTFLYSTLKVRPFLYLLIVKFTPYLALPGLIFAGHKKLKLSKFIIYSFIISIFVKILYIVIGYSGSIGIRQMNNIISGWKQIVLYIIVGVILFLFSRKLYKYIGQKIKTND